MKRVLKLMVVSVMTLFGVGVCAYAAEFSADMVSSAGGQTVQSKISVKANKSRVEMPQAIMINRGDLGVAWMIMPSEGMYMEHPLDTKTLAQTSADAQGQAERVLMGKEAIDGKLYDKSKVTYKTANSSETMLQWTGPDSIPVKAAALNDSWSVEYRNIKTSGIDDSIFEIPQGLQKMQMPTMAGLRQSSGDAGGMGE